MVQHGYHQDTGTHFILTGIEKGKDTRRALKWNSSYYEIVKAKSELIRSGKYFDMKIEEKEKNRH